MNQKSVWVSNETVSPGDTSVTTSVTQKMLKYGKIQNGKIL